MPFLSQIPQATDQLSISQGNILNNFSVLGVIAGNTTANTASLNDTVGFNFVNLALPGSPANTGANQMALYTGTLLGAQQLYVVSPNNTKRIPMTASTTATQNNIGFTGQSTGWTYLPSGCKMIWGNAITTGAAPNANTVIVYNTVSGFPGFTVGTSVQVTRFTSTTPTVNNFMYVQQQNLTQFTVYQSSGAVGAQFSWFAIGN